MANPPYPFLKRFVIKSPALREFLAEFFGTFILYIFGGASFAHYIFGNQKDVLAVTFCWGMGVMLGIQTGAGVSGGHVNPVVTTSFASVGRLPWRKVPHYILGQHLGAFVASAILYFNYIDVLDHYDGGERQIFGNKGTGILLTTFPNENVHLSICIFDTIICSALLMFTIMVIIDNKNANTTAGMHAFLIGIMVIALCWAFGTNCMAAINPARDFPPRVLASMVGYGPEVFTFRHFWWIPMFIPHVGGLIGTWLYVLAIEMHIRPERLHDDRAEREMTNLLPLPPRTEKSAA
ncbi:aquaporin-7-like [Ornithodoros turicata]